MSSPAPLASRRRRLLATLIDAVLVPSLTLFLIMVTEIMEQAEDYITNMWMVWVLVLAVVSYLILNGYGLWKHGQTLGKKFTGIAIVAARDDGNQAPDQLAPLWKLIAVRALFFPLLFIGLIPPLTLLPLADVAFIFSRRRRCLHDMLCATDVVRISKD